MAPKIQHLALHVTGPAGTALLGVEGAPDPLARRIDLAPDLWIGPLNKEVSTAVFETCRSKSLRADEVDVRCPRYAIVWDGCDSRDLDWDPRERVRVHVALSRLIRPTTFGFEFAARVEYREGVIYNVEPADVAFGRSAYPIEEPLRDWLSESDALELTRLASAFIGRRHPDRVQRALYAHEYTLWTMERLARWPLACTALESLVHTERSGSTRQFVTRSVALARIVGVTTFTSDDAERAYDLRSSLAHGRGVGDSTHSSDVMLFRDVELVLRLTLRRAIEDEVFEQHFASNDRVVALLGA